MPLSESKPRYHASVSMWKLRYHMHLNLSGNTDMTCLCVNVENPDITAERSEHSTQHTAYPSPGLLVAGRPKPMRQSTSAAPNDLRENTKRKNRTYIPIPTRSHRLPSGCCYGGNTVLRTNIMVRKQRGIPGFRVHTGSNYSAPPV